MKKLLLIFSFLLGIFLMYYISNEIVNYEVDDDYLLIKNDINLLFDGHSKISTLSSFKKPNCQDSEWLPWFSQTSKSYGLIGGIPCFINAQWKNGVHIPEITHLRGSSLKSGCTSGCGDDFSNFITQLKIERVWNCDQGSIYIYTLIKGSNDEFHLITQTTDDVSFKKYNSEIGYSYILDIHEDLFSFFKGQDSYIPNKFHDIYHFQDNNIETKFHNVEKKNEFSWMPHHSNFHEFPDDYGSRIYLDFKQESYIIDTKDDDINQAIWSRFYLFCGVFIFLFSIIFIFLFYRNK